MASREESNDLKKNTIIIAVFNLGSKAITFILAPLYSYYLTTEQYGSMDLITTTASLLLPFICFDIYEATFRFANDCDYDPKSVFSSSIIVAGIGTFTGAIIVLIVSLFSTLNIYIIFIGIFGILDVFITIMSQFARGRNQMKVFASSGVINAIALLLSNLVFLLLLGLELKGWLISFLIGKIFVLIYLIRAINFYKYFSFKSVKKEYIFIFLKFCIPLLPTATMWWIMNVSDRYMLAYFIGTAATGIYSVSNKFPNIMSSFENVFYQAWQTTAIRTRNIPDRDDYYSEILKKYITILLITVIGMLTLIKPLIDIMFASQYSSSWICTPFLLLGIIIHAVNGNLGSLYTVFKHTKGAFYSTFIGALSNIILNLFLIPVAGIIGAALTTLIGYIITFIYRWYDVKRFTHLSLIDKRLNFLYILLVLQIILFYFPANWSYLIRMLITIIACYNNRTLLIGIIRRQK